MHHPTIISLKTSHIITETTIAIVSNAAYCVATIKVLDSSNPVYEVQRCWLVTEAWTWSWTHQSCNVHHALRCDVHRNRPVRICGMRRVIWMPNFVAIRSSTLLGSSMFMHVHASGTPSCVLHAVQVLCFSVSWASRSSASTKKTTTGARYPQRQVWVVHGLVDSHCILAKCLAESIFPCPQQLVKCSFCFDSKGHIVLAGSWGL